MAKPNPKLIHLRIDSNDSYAECDEDTPCRTMYDTTEHPAGKLGYLKEFPVHMAVEVFRDSRWVEATIMPKPTEHVFHVSVVGYGSETDVGRELHKRLVPGEPNTVMVWVKIVPPSKQAGGPTTKLAV